MGERLVEVPQTQVAEVVRQVPVHSVVEVQRQIPRVETRVIEKVVPVPCMLTQEVAREVPQVCVQEVMRQVAAPQKRFVQTGIEYEHRVDRSAVVVGTGQVEYGGCYNGPMRTYQGLVREVSPMCMRG